MSAAAVTSPVTATRDGGVLVVRLANGAKRNPINMPMAQALGDAFENAGDAGAIALLHDGDHFCVGGDVRAMAAAEDRGPFVQQLADELHRTLRAIAVGVPVVVGVRGWAAGAGMSLAIACDLMVAGESASFQPAYSGIAVTPDGGMTWTLPRVVGERRARSILLQNSVTAAAEALTLGMADHVVPDEDVESTALTLAHRLADGPRGALLGAKRLVTASATASFADHLDAESASIAACAESADGREGIAAFLERRKPVFGG